MNQGFSNDPNSYGKSSPYSPSTSDTSNPYVQSPEINNPQVPYPSSNDINQNLIPQDTNFAADSNPLLAKKNSKHARVIIGTILLSAAVLDVVILSANGSDMQVGGMIGIVIGGYLIYLLLCLCCNPLFSYLGNVQHGTNFEQEYNKIREILGYFSFHVVCYHYQTRHHTRTVTDSNGNTRTQHYTTTEKVITHQATETLSPKQSVDISGAADQIQAQTEVVFVHNKVNYKFKDSYSSNRFNAEYYSFQRRHKMDAYQDYSQQFLLPGLKPRQCFYVGKEVKNHKCYFILWTLCGLSLPYCIYLEGKITRFDIEYLKELTMH